LSEYVGAVVSSSGDGGCPHQKLRRRSEEPSRSCYQDFPARSSRVRKRELESPRIAVVHGGRTTGEYVLAWQRRGAMVKRRAVRSRNVRQLDRCSPGRVWTPVERRRLGSRRGIHRESNRGSFGRHYARLLWRVQSPRSRRRCCQIATASRCYRRGAVPRAAPMRPIGGNTSGGRRTISRDILHFPARVLVIQASRGCSRAATLIPDTVLPIYSCGARFPVLPASPPDARARAPWSERRSALHGHATASTDGHVSHDADRFASRRVRRAAAARDVRSAGTAYPVPKI
jgi:hypothetical protein